MDTSNQEPMPDFDYEVFDRQINNFCLMMQVMINGWEDYNSQEMTFDIISLCNKASRLCYMADQDFVLQNADVSKERKGENQAWFDVFSILVTRSFSEFLRNIFANLKKGKVIEGHPSPMIQNEMMTLVPKIHDLLRNDGMSEEEIEKAVMMINFTEMEIINNQKATQFPDVRYEERLWYLIRLFVMTCYLLQHFQRMFQLTSQDMDADEAGRLTELAVQKYMSDTETRNKLDLYFANLQYDNDGKPLSLDQLLKARRELKDIVPESLKLPFLKNAGDNLLIGEQIRHLEYTAEEFMLLIEAEAKYQIITEHIFEIKYPELAEPSLPNEVFNTIINNRLVDMEEVRKTIGRMLHLVRQKNHWFCVWSVLKHLNLLKPNSTFAGFAHQMMSPEWFGFLSKDLHFTGDNLSDFSRYFAEIDFTKWDRETFLQKKELFGMTKWSDKLFDKFSSLCREMFYSIRGYQFLEDIG